jgi:hypothetical protein
LGRFFSRLGVTRAEMKCIAVDCDLAQNGRLFLMRGSKVKSCEMNVSGRLS